jgi:hypothetical protein
VKAATEAGSTVEQGSVGKNRRTTKIGAKHFVRWMECSYRNDEVQ